MIVTQREYNPIDAALIDPLNPWPDCSKEDINISTEAYTVLYGQTIACIWGKLSCWDDRAILWGVMAKQAKYCMKQIFEFAFSVVESSVEQRLELQVAKGFAAGVRFAEMLGFERECLMRKYSCGKDAYLYARIQ